MAAAEAQTAVSGLQWMLGYDLAAVKELFLTPGGAFSIASLFSNLCIGLWLFSRHQRTSRRTVNPKALLRVALPKRLYKSASGRADIGFALFNMLVFGLMFGWAIVTSHSIGTTLNAFLAAHVGKLSPAPIPDLAAMILVTVGLYVAFELGYWLNHYLAHEVPALWELHKVHHTAEHLSPLTNFRVHPLYTIMFLNIAAVFTGTADGLLTWALGRPVAPLTLFDTNVIVFTFTYLFEHLHHSHFWIVFPGWLGKLFISPAHHQIHHSADIAHFNKNYGNTLAVFDWLFGTLLLPTRRRQKLRFGVDPITRNDHSFQGAMIEPVIGLWGHIKSALHAAGTEPAASTAPTATSTSRVDTPPTSAAR